MSLNRLSEFAKIAQKIESDTDYYTWGRPQSIGILENLLAYFGVEFEHQKPARLCTEKISHALNASSRMRQQQNK